MNKHLDAQHLALGPMVALWMFGVAQPLLDICAKYPQFFIAHHFLPTDFALFVLFWCILPPTALFLTVLLISKLNRLFARVCLSLLIAALSATVYLQLADSETRVSLFTAAVLGGLFAFAVEKSKPLHSILNIAAISVVLFPLVFLFKTWNLIGSQIQAPMEHQVTATTPVVMLVFDELPLSSLLAETNRIDAERFPNFAELAKHSTWYPAARTVADTTAVALPALLTGLHPNPELESASYYANSPRNLFSFLDASYDLNVVEPVTWLCPDHVCAKKPHKLLTRFSQIARDSVTIYLHTLLPEDLRQRIPAIGNRWKNFAASDTKRASKVNREEHSKAVLTSLAQPLERSLNFFHLLMPHTPWNRYSDGRFYTTQGNHSVLGLNQYKKWGPDQRAVEVGFQRHLMQLAYTDHFLGKVLNALRNSGQWDDSLLIVLADHGASFRVDEQFRYASKSNLRDILAIPLFIKYPNQHQGELNRKAADLTDILPTIVDVLDAETNWEFDGISLLEPKSPVEDSFSYAASGVFHRFQMQQTDAAIWQKPVRPNPLRAILGVSGSELYSFDMSSDKSLLGLSSTELDAEDTAFELLQSNAEQLRIPAHSMTAQPGLLRAQLPPHFFESQARIAVAVNGTIHGVTDLHPEGHGEFDVLLPSSAFSNESNNVELFYRIDSDARWSRLASSVGG